MRQRLPRPISLIFLAAITGFVVASINRTAHINDPAHASAVWTLNGLAAGIVGAATGFLPMWAIYRRRTARWKDLAFVGGTSGAFVGFEIGSVIMTAFSVGIAFQVVGWLLRDTDRSTWWIAGGGLEPGPAHHIPAEALRLMSARLIRRGWLLRGIEISLSDGIHSVEYNGRGLGYEQVSFDGAVIRKSWYWFVPRFEFKLGGYPSVVEVRVWPWLLLRTLVLRVGDRVVYTEGTGGRDEKQIGVPNDWEELA